MKVTDSVDGEMAESEIVWKRMSKSRISKWCKTSAPIAISSGNSTMKFYAAHSMVSQYSRGITLVKIVKNVKRNKS